MEAEEYRRMAEVESSHWWYAATRAMLRQELAPRLVAGGRFLDAGGGTGATAAWLAEHGELIAADFEPAALVLNRELHPATAGFVAADLARLPVRRGVVRRRDLRHGAVPPAVADPIAAVRGARPGRPPGGVRVPVGAGCTAVAPSPRSRDACRPPVLARGPPIGRRGAGLVVERATGAHSYLVVPPQQ